MRGLQILCNNLDMCDFFAKSQKPTSLIALEDMKELCNVERVPADKRRRADPDSLLPYCHTESPFAFSRGQGEM